MTWWRWLTLPLWGPVVVLVVVACLFYWGLLSLIERID